MSIYKSYIFDTHLISPINGYQCKRINSQNIANFGFSSMEEFKEKLPNFPTRCKQSEITQNNNNEILLKSNYSNKIQELNIEKYNKNPKLCKHCNSAISYQKRENSYCDHSCAATHTNKTKVYTKKNKIKQKPVKKLKHKNCYICDTKFSTYGTGKTCSKLCHSSLLSSSQKKSIESSGGNRRRNMGRHKRSYLERSFSEWLDSYSIKYEIEYQIKRYNDDGSYRCSYYADFYFKDLNLIIELDGSTHDTPEAKAFDLDRDSYIQENHNLKIIRINHRDYRSKKFVPIICKLLGIDI